VPVIWFYRHDLASIARDLVSRDRPVGEREGLRWLFLVGLATLPTGLLGVVFKDLFEQLFATPAALTVTFAITGVILFVTGRLEAGARTLGEVTWQHALLLGLAQGFAITPGISRSGTTIAVALLLGFRRDLAARFSFLMSVPAILGAMGLQLLDLGGQQGAVALDQALIGGVVAMGVGYLALTFLVWLVQRGRLGVFAWYCWGAAVVAAVLAAA
jgi:undecaprenyl-diphosphatase